MRMLFALAAVSVSFHVQAKPLSKDQLFACFKAVEQVRWDEREWPAGNEEPKPALSSVLPDSQLQARVDDVLRMRGALRERYGVEISAASVQHEIDRMQRQSRMPARLAKRFEAAGGDAAHVADCIAGPALVERKLRDYFAWDTALHGAQRAQLDALDDAAVAADPSALPVHYILQRQSGEATETADGTTIVEVSPGSFESMVAQFSNASDTRAKGTAQVALIRETPTHFQRVTAQRLSDDALEITGHSWRKREFEAWWPEQRKQSTPASTGFDVPEGAIAPLSESFAKSADNTWDASIPFLPTARSRHTAVWTGSEMLVWGGIDAAGQALDTGFRYDPVTDDIQPLGTLGVVPGPRYDHTAVWTGTQMLVWGGKRDNVGAAGWLATGARFNPANNTWTTITALNAPPGSRSHTAVWSGNRMVVWGGEGSGASSPPSTGALNTGGVYNPASDVWTAVSEVNAPSARRWHSAVAIPASGRMIVWGGNCSGTVNGTSACGHAAPAERGRIYDVGTNSWLTLPTSNAPAARYHAAVKLIGNYVVIWGGTLDGGLGAASGGRFQLQTGLWSPTNSGASAPVAQPRPSATAGDSLLLLWNGPGQGFTYDPSTDGWTQLATSNEPSARSGHTLSWTGSDLLVWGGLTGAQPTNTGARLNLASNTWLPSTLSQPIERALHTSVWTGAEMLIFGGVDALGAADTGARFDPVDFTWTLIPSPCSGCGPGQSGRIRHTALWTGTEMIVWGGLLGGTPTATGVRYSPTLRKWDEVPMHASLQARYDHTAVWSGTRMLVWGGLDANHQPLGSGHRYTPAQSGLFAWGTLPTGNAPSPRSQHSAVWTGSEMIIWGGAQGSTTLGNGARYNMAQNAWKPMTSAGVPAARARHTAVWSGNSMLVWGGANGATAMNSGARFDPNLSDPNDPTQSGTWTALATQDAPSARADHSALWTGQSMLVWGGGSQQGGLYFPDANGGAGDWQPTSTVAAPPATSTHRAVWTGDAMIVWPRLGIYYPHGYNQPPEIAVQSLTVPESAAVGEKFGPVVATDDALPAPPGALAYTLLSPGAGPLTLGTDGRIEVTGALDYETTPQYTLDVQVGDGEFTAHALVTVGIGDVVGGPGTENQAPVVPAQEYEISEKAATGTVLAAPLQAQDDGFPSTPGALEFHLDTAVSPFLLSTTGTLELAGGLDYETQSTFYLSITVNDGQLQSQQVVTVHVLDVGGADDLNDAPVATDATFSVNENAAFGTPVGTVVATDADANDTLAWAITAGNADDAFAIDATGQLTVDMPQALDYESRPAYALTVSVTDPSGLTDTANVTVNLNDVGGSDDINEAPVANDANFLVPETAAVNTLVGTVTATDADGNDPRTWSIVAGNGSGSFAIDAQTGALRLALPLDFETVPAFALTVRATDAGGLSDDASVQIVVMDVGGPDDVNVAPTANDDAFEVAENATIGTLVGTLTGDAADANDVLAWSLTAGNIGGAFQLAADGALSVAKALDFETRPTYTLEVKATDSGGLTDTAIIQISVKDVGGQDDVNVAPTLQQSGFDIAENALPGAIVGTVPSFDPDFNDELDWTILAGDPDQHFLIETGGTISVSGALDFETQSQYVLSVRATDNGGLFDTVQVTVKVLDVGGADDFNLPPNAADASFAIAENAPSTTVGKVSATDGDLGDGETWAITDGNAAALFAIDSQSGNIRTMAPLDYETASSHVLIVSVTDNGGLSDTATVEITVLDVGGPDDVNDAPVVQDAALSVDEDVLVSSLVGTLQAVDPDPNDVLAWSILTGNGDGAFTLDAATGELRTAKALDFETTPAYTLTVQVIDPEGLSDTAALQISLLDAGGADDIDDAPVASDATFAVDEGVPASTPVGSVPATDADAGDVLTWTITSGNAGGAFAIDAAVGLISTLGNIDFETVPAYTLGITVSDSSGLQDTATVQVTVNDVGGPDDLNVAPVAVDAAFQVLENVPSGTSLGTLQATDADANDTKTWAITAGNAGGAFKIDATTGTLSTAASLDFETAPNHALTVSVTDSGGLQDTAMVTITVRDFGGPDDQNLAPTAIDTAFSIAETIPVGTLVGMLVATDPDINDVPAWSLVAGNTGGAFALDAVTGELRTAALLDFETLAAYSLTVRVTDQGGLQDTATVQVSLIDIGGPDDLNVAPTANDAAFTVAEGAAPGTVVGTVTATDPDLNDTRSWSITAGNPGDAFQIDPATGTIATNALIDFETTPAYMLTVRVVDAGGLQDVAAVQIAVTDLGGPDDINEAPAASDAGFQVAENAGVGTVVGTVTAIDSDLNDTQAWAIIAGNASGHFAIDAVTGVVVTAGALDFETQPAYTLTVRVTDAAGAPDIAAVQIAVLDVGGPDDVNLAPVATDAGFAVNEGVPNGTAVGTVLATDADANELLQWSIIAGNTNGAFAIETDTGAIVTANALDFETVPAYTLTVAVIDNGGLQDTATVQIAINDVGGPDDDSSAPVAEDAAFQVSESVAVGTVVGTVIANDADLNDTLAWSIVAGNVGGAFQIDTATGVIRTAALLDFETLAAYALTVRAVDNGGLQDSAAVQIAVMDIGGPDDLNLPPVANDATFQVPETAAPGALIGTVSANDSDINEVLSWAIAAGNIGNAFTIDAGTGAIRVAAGLDFEQRPAYSLTVTVTDNGGLQDAAAVQIAVLDVGGPDDLNVAPVANDAAFAVVENAPPGTAVGTVTSTDADINDTKAWEIIAGNVGNAFVIDAVTGSIATAAPLDFEAVAAYTLTVRVTDSGGLQDTAAVQIAVTDMGGSDDINDAPVVVDAVFRIENAAVNGTPVGTVTATDPDPADTRLWSIVAGNVGAAFAIDPAVGAITTSGVIDFATLPTYTLTVRVTDAGGLFDEGTVVVNVDDPDSGGGNNPPVAADDQFFATQDLSMTVAAPGVLGNDSDPDLDVLTVQLIGAPSVPGATVTLQAHGGFDFTPPPGFVDDVVTFTYRVTDAKGETDDAVVAVFVQPGALFKDGFED